LRRINGRASTGSRSQQRIEGARIPPDMSNIYCLPGKAGGSPMILGIGDWPQHRLRCGSWRGHEVGETVNRRSALSCRTPTRLPVLRATATAARRHSGAVAILAGLAVGSSAEFSDEVARPRSAARFSVSRRLRNRQSVRRSYESLPPVSDLRTPLSPAHEDRSRGRSYLLFQTHGLHLKKIDGLGLQVIENSRGEPTTEHQRGVDVDAIGLHVRPCNWGVTMHDILFVRRFVFQKRVANPQLVIILLLLQPDAWADPRVNVVAELVLAGSRQRSEPLGIVQQDFRIRIPLDGRIAPVARVHPDLPIAQLATEHGLNHHILVVALQVHDGLEDRVLPCQATADQLHDTKRVGAAIDVVAQRD
jgi:hypothetical protein